MKHRVFNLAAAVSLVMLLAVVALWVRSYWTIDGFYYSRPRWAVFMDSGGGQFGFEHVRAMPESSRVRDPGFSHFTDRSDGPLRDGMRMPGSQSHFDRWGFWIVTGERWGDDHIAVLLPAWFAFSGCLILPLAWTWRLLRAKGEDGLCPQCGYDLRATPDRCPECGTPTPSTGSAHAASGASRADLPEKIQ